MELSERCRKIKLLLMDCDGVLTDGRLYYGPAGEALKVFNARDGVGIKALHTAGILTGIVSGRNSDIVSLRAAELGIEFVYQGIDGKHSALAEIAAEAEVGQDEIAYIGDDTPDIEIFEHVGLAIAVADAHETTRAVVHYITKSKGGRGAVREIADLLLNAKIDS